MISSFWKRSARSMKSSRCMCPNLWIFSRRWLARTKLSSVMRIFAWNTGGNALRLAILPAAVEALHDQQEPLDVLDVDGGKIDGWRLHLHHPPPGDVDRKGGDMVEMGVRNQPGGSAHEVPRLGAEVEAEL